MNGECAFCCHCGELEQVGTKLKKGCTKAENYGKMISTIFDMIFREGETLHTRNCIKVSFSVFLLISIVICQLSVSASSSEEGDELYTIKGSILEEDMLRFDIGANENMIEENGNSYVGNPSSGEGCSFLYDEENILSQYPFTVEFDFMLRNSGSYNSRSSATTSFPSLISWNTTAIVNNKKKTTKGPILKIGGVDLRKDEDDEFDKQFLVMARDYVIGYSNKESIYQTYKVDGTTYYSTDESAIYSLSPREWIHIAIAVDPAGSATVYIDGKMITMLSNEVGRSAFSMSTQTVVSSYLSFGDDFDRYEFDYGIDNIAVRVNTPEEFYKIDATNELFSLDFEGYHFDSKYRKIGSALASFTAEGLDTYTISEHIMKSGDARSYAKFSITDMQACEEGRTYMDVSLTSRIGGELYTPVAGKRYIVQASFALENGQSASSKLPLFAIGKYSSSYTGLLYTNDNGYFVKTIMGDMYLYNSEGIRLTPYCESDESGMPECFSNVCLLVDELTNNVSVYINNTLAKACSTDGAKVDVTMLTAAADLTLLVVPDDACKPDGWDGTLSTLKYSIDADGAVAYQYIRFFSGVPSFSLVDMSIYLIPDSRPEFVGVQRSILVTDTYDLRFIAALDDIFLSNVGFHVQVDFDGKNKTQTVTGNTVFETINQAGLPPLKACQISEGQYLMALAISGIPSDGTYRFTIRPFVTDRKGQVIWGEPHTVICSDWGETITIDPD